MKRLTSITMVLLLMSIFLCVFTPNPSVVGANGTIYIRINGSVEPSIAPIVTSDNVTYVFTDSTSDSVVVERSNIVIDGNGSTIQSSQMQSNSKGIWFESANNVTIKNLKIKGFEYGIRINSTLHTTVYGNNITNNRCGVLLELSSNASLSNNNIEMNEDNGINFTSSSNNSLTGNNITSNAQNGIYINNSPGNNITGNNVLNNEYGIVLTRSPGNVLRNNIMENNTYNFGVYGSRLASDFINDVDPSNTVNGKPIYYWINELNSTVPPDAGFVALINCTRITVRDSTLEHCITGVLLICTNESLIENVTCLSNLYGIHLGYSAHNTIIDNMLASQKFAVSITNSSLNYIYHNNFVNNMEQVFNDNSTNIWDDGYPSGGNYWSDYLIKYSNATEIGSSGIWDTSYALDGYNQDRYPLVREYAIPEFPSFLILSLFMIASLLAAIIHRRKSDSSKTNGRSF